MKRNMLFLLFLGFVTIFLMGCGGTSSNNPEEESYNPTIEPDNFTDSTTIDNKYFTSIPGEIFTYEGETEEGSLLVQYILSFDIVHNLAYNLVHNI